MSMETSRKVGGNWTQNWRREEKDHRREGGYTTLLIGGGFTGRSEGENQILIWEGGSQKPVKEEKTHKWDAGSQKQVREEVGGRK